MPELSRNIANKTYKHCDEFYERYREVKEKGKAETDAFLSKNEHTAKFCEEVYAAFKEMLLNSKNLGSNKAAEVMNKTAEVVNNAAPVINETNPLQIKTYAWGTGMYTKLGEDTYLAVKPIIDTKHGGIGIQVSLSFDSCPPSPTETPFIGALLLLLISTKSFRNQQW